ncbi:MAG: hypothetical protein M0D54_13645 [Hyphomonadaceae bacterium JAD_PAG50586_4]|nr:MAG: hypothetical protein M0D54_13645 [Hyphomonadaceae bacterium JAD_PAG50586_4]
MAQASLTHRTKTGAPYLRPAAVEEQIGVILASQNPLSFCLDEHNWAEMRLETLVFLARWRARVQDCVAAGHFVRLILERAQKIVRRWSRGFSLADSEEIETVVVLRLVELLLARPPSRTAEFLEIDAGAVIKQTTLREVAKRRDRPRPHDFAKSAEGQEALAQIADPNATSDAALTEAYAPISLRRALKAIKDRRHRQAFILHKLRGWPVQSEKSGQPSLVGRFNMSKRQIHTWISIAASQVKHALGDA